MAMNILKIKDSASMNILLVLLSDAPLVVWFREQYLRYTPNNLFFPRAFIMQKPDGPVNAYSIMGAPW